MIAQWDEVFSEGKKIFSNTTAFSWNIYTWKVICVLYNKNIVSIVKLKSKRFKNDLVESCQDPLLKRNLNFCAIQQGYWENHVLLFISFILNWKQKVCWQCLAIFRLFTLCSVQPKIQMLTTWCGIFSRFHPRSFPIRLLRTPY